MMELNERQKEAVRTLAGDPNFNEYLKLLDGQISLRTEDLVTATKRSGYHRGWVLGLREARHFVGTQLKTLDRKDVRDRNERTADTRKREQRRIATFGSSWFRKV